MTLSSPASACAAAGTGLCLIHNTLHSGDSFMFLFLNSPVAPGGETIPNLSMLHVAVFLLGVQHYRSLWDAAGGAVVLVSPWHTPGQSSRAVSYLSLWDAWCFPSSSSRSCRAQHRWVFTAC